MLRAVKKHESDGVVESGTNDRLSFVSNLKERREFLQLTITM